MVANDKIAVPAKVLPASVFTPSDGIPIEINAPTAVLDVPAEIQLSITENFMLDAREFRASFWWNNVRYKVGFTCLEEILHSLEQKDIFELVSRKLTDEIQNRFDFSEPQADYIYLRMISLLNGKTAPGIPNVISYDAFLPNNSVSFDISAETMGLPGVSTKIQFEYLPKVCREHQVCSSALAVKKKIPKTLWQEIQHLNDYHHMSREDIADWIDKLHDAGIIDVEF